MVVCVNCGKEITLRQDGVWIHKDQSPSAMCLLGRYAWAEPKRGNGQCEGCETC